MSFPLLSALYCLPLAAVLLLGVFGVSAGVLIAVVRRLWAPAPERAA